MEFGQVFANVIAYAKLAFRCHDFVELLILELLTAQRIVAFDLPTLLLVCINFR